MNSKETLKNEPSKRFKNTDCPFSMTLKFKKEDKQELFYCQKRTGNISVQPEAVKRRRTSNIEWK